MKPRLLTAALLGMLANAQVFTGGGPDLQLRTPKPGKIEGANRRLAKFRAQRPWRSWRGTRRHPSKRRFAEGRRIR
jgi:hypothetical protein